MLTIAAGLPNIQGIAIFHQHSVNKGDGKLFTVSNGASAYPAGETGIMGYNNLHFDASKSNTIYGNSLTVQSPALSLIVQIKY